MNVVIARTISKESIISPPSKCPKCQHKLYWWHNIPLISFLLLKGRCYFCNKSISPRYPIIEILGMIIVAFSFYRYISVFDAISVVFILSFVFVMAYTDFEIKKVSPMHALLVVFFGFVFNRYDVINSVTGMLVGAGIISAIIFICQNLLKKESFGVGDIFLIGTLGSVVGFDRLFYYIICLLLIQFIFVLPEYIISLIQSEQIQTLKYLIIFCITCLFLYVSKNVTFWGSTIVLICFSGMLLVSASQLTRNIFYTIKSSESLSYYPLAPAFAICCVLFLC